MLGDDRPVAMVVIGVVGVALVTLLFLAASSHGAVAHIRMSTSASMRPVEWLTLALVAITGYYAVQNQRMVREMRRTREMSVRPDLRVDLTITHGTNEVSVDLINAGQGHAIDVNLTMVYVRLGGVKERTETVRWEGHVVGAGERHAFVPPSGDGEQPMTIERLIESYEQLSVSGTVKDSLGVEHLFERTISDFPHLWDVHKQSGHSIPASPAQGINKELNEINETLGRIASHLDFMTRHVRAPRRLPALDDGSLQEPTETSS